MLINVYKPIYLTPLQVVDKLRATYPEYKDEKIGYAGRLDPLAHGVLLLMVGEETKHREKYLDLPKTYEFEALFGLETDSYDLLGIVNNKSQIRSPKSEIRNNTKIQKAKNKKRLENFEFKTFEFVSDFDIRISDLKAFTKNKLGPQTQPYPPFSSKAVGGKPLHWWAKQGRLSEIAIPEREIEIYSFELLSTGVITAEDLQKKIQESVSSVQGHFRQKEILETWNNYFNPERSRRTSTLNSQLSTYNTARFRVSCSSGTYVRGLVHELGQYLGCGAITTEIFRTKAGEYTIEDSLNFAKGLESGD